MARRIVDGLSSGLAMETESQKGCHCLSASLGSAMLAQGRESDEWEMICFVL